MPADHPFSKRNHFAAQKAEITVREDAPESLRLTVLNKVVELKYAPSTLREIICNVLRRRPDANNWSEYPNIWAEVESLMYSCPWYKVYDIIEAIYAEMVDGERNKNARAFAEEINMVCVEEGIGWQFVDGEVISRGGEAMEGVLTRAATALLESSRPTAASHLREAIQGMSRRPTPDLSGAIYHAMGSLECVARDVAENPKATLGEILKRNDSLVPKPLDTALSQVWGYASNVARHVEEGKEPSREEAELIVGLAAAVSTYLIKRT